MNRTTGMWFGWLGVIFAMIGLFWQPIFMGALAIVLGATGLFTPIKNVNWASMVLGVLVIVIRTL